MEQDTEITIIKCISLDSIQSHYISKDPLRARDAVIVILNSTAQYMRQ